MCMTETDLDPETRKIKNIRLSGNESEIANVLREESKQGNRDSILSKIILVAIETELKSASERSIESDANFLFLVCAGLSAGFALLAFLHMNVLREESKQGNRDSILSKIILVAIETELKSASERSIESDANFLFLVCAGLLAGFALLAFLHMVIGLLMSCRYSKN
ncbi:unnamed protein product [Strongylus vulgaris]|uniref:Uncharacterized protein n=1 Tax=Strongylus vulgaris TaxID=40348 RepID=A0A3P7LDR4_STRVU|nr:unnamed protein product [Strongylus vulgaris]